MITKKELKEEVDKLPESLVDEVYGILKQVVTQRKVLDAHNWSAWKQHLHNFTPDFMETRGHAAQQNRESFDV